MKTLTNLNDMPEHSDLMGGSTASRRINCTASYEEEMKYPRGETSEYAEEGTALHLAMEHRLLEMDPEEPNSELLGMVFNDHVITTELLYEKIVPAYEAFLEIVEKFGGGLDYMVEVRSGLNGVIDGAYGTIDILGKFASGKVLVLDWKFGDGIPVKVKENNQLGFYAGCALYSEDEEVKEMIGSEKHLDFVFAVVQPRRGYDGQCYEVWETTSSWVEDFLDIAVNAIDAIKNGDTYHSTGAWCKFCRAEWNCPKKANSIIEAEKLPVAEIEVDVVKLSAALTLASDMENWVKAVRKMGKSQLDNGVKIPGYKLVAKRPTRKYADTEKARGVLVRQLKTEAAHKPRELITPPQAEKALGKAKYKKLLAKYVESKSSGTTLAPAHDSREDVNDGLLKLDGITEKQGTLFSDTGKDVT